ncbi:MAG: PEP-CTERM sorting domain-containing protein [Inhella sp.]
MRLTAIAALVLSAVLPCAQANSNLVVNGSFEATAVATGGWVNVASIEGWTWLAGPGTGFELRNNAVGTAFDGSNFIELDTNGNTTIGQSFTHLVAGGSYQLSFAYSPRINESTGTNGIQVLWNGQQLGSTLSAQGGNVHGWVVHSFDVSALAGTNWLSFRAVGKSDSLGGSLDAVRLVSQVPEPTSYALMLGGLFAIALLKRRRQPTA